MADSVVLPFPIDTIAPAVEKPSKTYRLDLDKGRIYSHIDGQEAVEQAIRKAIITPRFKCLIYNNQYGSEIQQAIIADDGTQAFIKAAAEGLIRDTLLPDSRIININNFQIELQDDECFISFQANTKFGEVEISEVI